MTQVTPEVLAAIQAATTASQWSLTNILILIGVVTTSIVTVINAWKGNSDRRILGEKVDDAQTNAAVTAAKVSNTAIAAARDVAALVDKRSNLQDQKLDEIHEATNGGVQALRDKVVVANDRIDALETLLKTALADLTVERAK